ncbi:MAG: glycosyltransferase [Bdellovibrionaceae bacterium]|nr:glycosyltransferase [Pseudobdellovibrionaceae bacterium]
MGNNYDLVVSVVIYKPNLTYLQQTLDSLSDCPLNIQVALHDNSPTRTHIEKLRSKHPIRYSWKAKNLGFGRGHNWNIRKLIHNSKYFLILNPDVYFDGHILTEMIHRMDQDSSIGLSIPKICHPSGHLQMVNRRLPRPQDYLFNFVNSNLGRRFLSTQTYKKYLLHDMNLNQPIECPTISGCFMLFRSPVLQSVGGFDKRFFLYLEDTDLSRRTAKKAKTVVFSDLVANHHWSRGAYKNIRLFSLFVNNLVRYFNKWGWFFDNERDLLNSKVCYYTPILTRKVKRNDSLLNNPEMFDSV